MGTSTPESAAEALSKRLEELLRDKPLASSPELTGGVRQAMAQLRRSEEELRSANDTLRSSQERLLLSAEAAGIGTWQWDLGRKQALWDDRCRALLGLSADVEPSFSLFLSAVHPEDRPRTEQAISRSLSERPDHENEFRVTWPDGSVHWLYAKGRVYPDPAGKPGLMVGVLMDVDHRKQAEARLQAARHEAEDASRAKSEFLANMSHEIRTPLNALLGMTELALMEEVSPKAREYLDHAKRSAKSLLDIINELLDVAKIEAGRVDLRQDDFDLRSSVTAALAPLESLAGRRGLQLAQSIEPAVPPVLRGDSGRLMQILTNLVGNAVKFTERGEVSVFVGLAGEGGVPSSEFQVPGPRTSTGNREPGTGNPVKLRFTVRDTGVGISEPELRTIFDPYVQAASHRSSGGTGLGLAISRQLVTLMGGKIWAESEVGRGSAFQFTVDLSPPGEPAVTPPPPASVAPGRLRAAPLRVLLAEDDRLNRILGREILERDGHKVVTVENGRQALEALAREPFDLVLMDIQMPEMDGLRAATAIRQGTVPGVPRDVPIVALSAHAFPGDRERFLASGMDDYVPKPMDLKEVYRILARVGRRPD